MESSRATSRPKGLAWSTHNGQVPQTSSVSPIRARRHDVVIVWLAGAIIGAAFYLTTVAPIWRASEPPHYFILVMSVPASFLFGCLVTAASLDVLGARGREWWSILAAAGWFPLANAFFWIWVTWINQRGPENAPDCCYDYQAGEPWPGVLLILLCAVMQMCWWLAFRRTKSHWLLRVLAITLAIIPLATFVWLRLHPELLD